MKPLTKKMLESGIVDIHVARLLERWGQVDIGASDLVGRALVTKKTFLDFAEDLEGLMAKKEDDEIHETRLDFSGDKVRVRIGSQEPITAYRNKMGQLLLPTTENLRGLHNGVSIHIATGEGAWESYEVIYMETLFQDEKMVALQVAVTRE